MNRNGNQSPLPARRRKADSRSGLYLCLILFILLLVSACRHLNPPVADAHHSFDEEMKDYVMVYSLPDKNDSLRAPLAQLFASPVLRQRFKAVAETGAGRETDAAGKLCLIGTPDTSPAVSEALKEFGVELGAQQATINGRSYALAPYAFVAHYKSKEKTVLLVALAKYDYLECVFLDEKTMPGEGTYSLLNADRRVVEQGTVQEAGDGSKLIPGAVHPAAAFIPEQRAKELKPVAAAASYVLTGPDDFSFVDRFAAGKKICFLGESPHEDPEIPSVILGTSLHLRKTLGYSVLGMESWYSLWPYLEDRSMGGAENLPNALPESQCRVEGDLVALIAPIIDYNRNIPSDQKLLCTAIDTDHAVNHTKPSTIRYLGYLAAKSSSAAARADLAGAIPALLKLHGRAEIHACLDDVERRFRAAWKSFSPPDRAEIAYTFELERASIDYQILSGGDSSRYADIRGEYYRKNIEHAFARAQASAGALICYVGGEHAKLTEPGPGDVPVRISEARYFSLEYHATRGRVASILIQRIGEAGRDKGSLEAAALACMGDKNRVFIDLRHPGWAAVKNRPGAFFSLNEPRYDGVLFIK